MSRVGAVVLSAGAWSQTSHLPGLIAHPSVDLLALSSPDAVRAAGLAAEFGTKGLTDWREALALGPDIAVVSSPPVAHEEMVVAALEAGAHVLVEKPFATSHAVACRMHEAAVRCGKVLLIGFGWPASPIFALTRRLIDAGAVGPVEHLAMHLAVNTRALLQGGTDGGWGGTETNAATYSDPSVSGGGAAAVSMSHQLGLVCWLLEDRIGQITAQTHPPGQRMDLHVASVATFRKGGSAAISCASTHPYMARPQWHMALYGGEGQILLNSVGDRLRLVRADGEVKEFGGAEARGEYDPTAPTTALIDCALGHAAPVALSSALATHVVAVTDAIYDSARSGATVTVPAET